jgi:hypothetical protein
MNETTERNRSRFKGTDGAIPPHRLTDLHYAVLKSLYHDRYLSADYLAALTGSSYKTWMLPLVASLRSNPYAYIKVSDQQRDKPALYMNVKLQYELTKLGAQTLFDRFGLTVPARKPIRYIEHQIMGDHAMASLRIGVNASNGRFAIMTRDDLLAHPNMPEKTRNSTAPNVIPLGGTIENDKGKRIAHNVHPDKEMFVLRDLEHGLSYFFPGFEIGTGSETHRPKDGRHDHSFTESKFEDYLTIIEKEIYASHFGSPNFYIMFLEPNIHRINNMMALFSEMTKRRRWTRPHFLFGIQHTFTQQYKADGHRLISPYHIVGENGEPTTFSLVN